MVFQGLACSILASAFASFL
uniref:Uncharacterized protein n=1 Tax=Rhizophora mucronata TaxID=61149 RepID=A0A2P2P7J4_RHIMU